MPRKRSFTHHSAVEIALSGLMREVPPGDIITYDAMSTQTSFDVLGGNRVVLNTARRRVEREGIYFSPVRGVGLVRLLHVEHLDESSRAAKSVARKAGRVRKMLSTVDVLALSRGDQRRLASHQGIWLMVSNALSPLGKEAPSRRRANPSTGDMGMQSVRVIRLPPPDATQ